MAEVSQRSWKLPGQRSKRLAWGYTVTVNGKRVRQYRSEWTKTEAEEALAKAKLGLEQQPSKSEQPGITVGQAVEKYLAAKTRKRTIAEDRRQLEHLKLVFGAETPLSQITAAKISAYKAQRLSMRSERTERPLTAAAVNRPLSLLRHLLRLAHEEWELLPSVPKIRLEKEPQGRIRWLEPDEQARVLAACEKSQSKHLLPLVTIAMETGLRKGELLGLTWSQVDMSRGVIRLEMTKSGKTPRGAHAAGGLQRPQPASWTARGPSMARWQHPHRLRERRCLGQPRLPPALPRSPTPLRFVVRDARWIGAGPTADPRPRHPGDDHALLAPLPESPPRRDDPYRELWCLGASSDARAG